MDKAKELLEVVDYNIWQDSNGVWHETCEECGDCILCGPCYCEIKQNDDE